MPYIPKSDRQDLYNLIRLPETVGELNYTLSLSLKEYLDKKGLSYQTINDIIGALENAKLEFYRRIAVPYESSKLSQNGDIYE